jgi:hypothetical protein
MKAETTVPTDAAQAHFDRLVAHFRTDHQLQVDVDGYRAEIILPDGWCAIEMKAEGLHLFLKVWDHAALEPAKAFFTRHLQRLVFQARTPVSWSHPWIEGAAPANIAAAKLHHLAVALDQAAALSERR